MKKRLIIIGIVSFLFIFAFSLTACKQPTDNNIFNPGGGAPATPTGVSASYNSTYNRVDIGWNAVTNASKYNIWRSESGINGTYFQIGYVTPPATGTFNTTSDPSSYPIVAGKTYYYKIDAENSSGTRSAKSAAAGPVTIPGGSSGAPATPTGFTATWDASKPGVKLSWYTVSGATYYNFWRSETGVDGTYTEIFYANNGSTPPNSPVYTHNEFSDTLPIVAGKTYYYKIDAESSSYVRSAKSAAAGPVTIPGGSGGTPGTSSSNAITLNAGIANMIYSDFISGYNEVWYKFDRYGPGSVYGFDRDDYDPEIAALLTGKINIDFYLYPDLSTPILSNMNVNAYFFGNSSLNGTFYLRVRPYANNTSNKGTFALVRYDTYSASSLPGNVKELKKMNLESLNIKGLKAKMMETKPIESAKPLMSE